MLQPLFSFNLVLWLVKVTAERCHMFVSWDICVYKNIFLHVSAQVSSQRWTQPSKALLPRSATDCPLAAVSLGSTGTEAESSADACSRCFPRRPQCARSHTQLSNPSISHQLRSLTAAALVNRSALGKPGGLEHCRTISYVKIFNVYSNILYLQYVTVLDKNRKCSLTCTHPLIWVTDGKQF